jgi:hypothetical protein
MKILIALWTACFIYVDDKFLQDSGPIYDFQDRFVRGISQEDPMLEAFAGLIREMSHHLHRVTANLFVTSTLNGVTGTILEKEMQGIQVSSSSPYFIYSQSSLGAGCRCQVSYVFSYHVNSSRSLRNPRISSKPASHFLHSRHA